MVLHGIIVLLALARGLYLARHLPTLLLSSIGGDELEPCTLLPLNSHVWAGFRPDIWPDHEIYKYGFARNLLWLFTHAESPEKVTKLYFLSAPTWMRTQCNILLYQSCQLYVYLDAWVRSGHPSTAHVEYELGRVLFSAQQILKCNLCQQSFKGWFYAMTLFDQTVSNQWSN